MNRISETFWIASAMVIATALVVVAVPIVAIVFLLALALPVAVQRVRRQRDTGDVVSPFIPKGQVGRRSLPPIIETTYTVVDRSVVR